MKQSFAQTGNLQLHTSLICRVCIQQTLPRWPAPMLHIAQECLVCRMRHDIHNSNTSRAEKHKHPLQLELSFVRLEVSQYVTDITHLREHLTVMLVRHRLGSVTPMLII